jgi:hypothetical protein
MKKYLITMLLNTAYFFTAFAQNNYDVKLIPAELLPHANVVKRLEEMRVEIKGPGKAVLYNKYAVTLLSGRFFIKVIKRSDIILFGGFNYLTI